MLTLLLILRLALAAVLAAAGVAKLLDRSASREALAQFGVPARAAAVLAPLLPLAELGTAALLLPQRTALWGAAAALALLLLFTAAVAYQLARGRAPTCRCFGQLSTAPVGRGTLLRNLLLAAAAGVVLWGGGGPGLGSWLGELTYEQLFLLGGALLFLLLCAAGGFLLFQTLRQQGRLLLRIEALEAQLAAGRPPEPRGGLPADTPAPEFSLLDLQGRRWSLAALRAGGTPLVLIFLDPTCNACTTLLPEIGRWQREAAGRVSLAVISRGSPAENRIETGAGAPTPLLLQLDNEVVDLYRVSLTPSAVGIRADGTIGAPLVEGIDAIRELVAPLLPSPAPARAENGRPAGAPAAGPNGGAALRAPDYSPSPRIGRGG